MYPLKRAPPGRVPSFLVGCCGTLTKPGLTRSSVRPRSRCRADCARACVAWKNFAPAVADRRRRSSLAPTQRGRHQSCISLPMQEPDRGRNSAEQSRGSQRLWESGRSWGSFANPMPWCGCAERVRICPTTFGFSPNVDPACGDVGKIGVRWEDVMQDQAHVGVGQAEAAANPAPDPAVNGSASGHELNQLLRALQAMRMGDFSVRMAAESTGLLGKIADTFNEIVTSNQHMARQLEQVGQLVGKEGRIRQRLRLGLATGSWGEMENSVNALIDDLLWPTIEATRTIEAVAQGDLLVSMRLDVDGRELKGEFLRSATIVNTMIKQLSVFTSEVTRVAREVGTDGKLGGQAQVREVTGVWKDLTESVNSMASNLTDQVRNIAEVTIAVANGDLSKKITVDVRGEILQLKEAINTMVDQLRSFASEVTRVAREVGTEGKLGGQAIVPGVAGTWKDLTDSVNAMCGNLTDQVRNIAQVTTAVARGDLSRKITVDVRGEILELKDTFNTMVDQLNSFASEVTRVAREVGTEGKLGGQAQVPGVAGTWKDLTDSVNFMASNLTSQVRNIAKVTTAVANGDLSQKITVPVRGEILELKNTINTMVDQLSSFASEVTRVAREVGTDGKLGGQAEVKGVAGTWKDLTDTVNVMAANLTNQVRAIAEVATAVTKGDLTRSIQVDARGEVAELKDNINTMIDNLRLTTDRNTEQDWLKTNLAEFTGMLQVSATWPPS